MISSNCIFAQRQSQFPWQQQEKLQFTELLMNHSPDPVFWVKPDKRLIYVNDAASSLFGYSRKKLLLMTIDQIYPDFSPEVWSHYWTTIKKQDSLQVESLHRTKQGQTLSVEIIISHIEYDGKEYGCIWSRDITARKQLEIALKKANQMLEYRFQERTAQLREANEQLCREIAERKRAEVELKKQVALSHRCAIELQQLSEPPSAEIEQPTARQSLFPNCPQLSEVFNFIESNYHQPIGLGDVAKTVGYSPAYLTDLVRRLTGQTVYRWIAERRMAAACSLLQETDQTIDQIAKSVGYRYAVCFFRQFRQSFGMTPQVWRNAQRESEATD